MSDCKRGIEDKYQWLVHQDLIEYCEGGTVWPIHVLNERKVRGVLFPRRVYTILSDVAFNYQVRVYTMNMWELFYFYVMRQSKVWTRRTNRTDCHFMRCFISKWGFTKWTEQIIARFRIEESCFELEETKLIIVQTIELGDFSSLRYSS